jgi:hypothetical protein
MAGRNKLTFARSSKFVFDLIDPERQKEIAPRWTSSSRRSSTWGRYRSARWHCTAETEIGTVRAKDLFPQARTIQLGGLGLGPILALHYDTAWLAGRHGWRRSEPRLTGSTPLQAGAVTSLIMSKFVRGDATARL